MTEQRNIHERLWWIAMFIVGGLFVGIIVAGLVGFMQNQNIKRAADKALGYDVELEDHGDDLRTSVLDVRHYHRNLAFGEVTRGGVEDFEEAYAQLQQEIDEIEELGVRDADTPQPGEIRAMADEYYDSFRPAVELSETDPEAFTEASDAGLVRIADMDSAAAEIDKLGEQLSGEALQQVEDASANARFVLLAVLGGLLLSGVALTYLATRTVRELRGSYASQQAAAAELARASQAKTDFIADASHELRTPLTVLRGNAEIGLQIDRNCVHAEVLEEIVQESGRMTGLVEDLLLLAHSDSGSLPLDLEQVAAAPFLTELAGRAEILARERGAYFQTTQLADGLLDIDIRRIEQAVLILVDNAAKYGQPGGPVTLTSAKQADELHVVVADKGPGIPEQDLPNIFERFYRVDKARSRKKGGTGLGLPIAKTIIEAHGGRIEAESRVGEGTRMTICLPLLRETRPADARPGTNNSFEGRTAPDRASSG